MKEFTKKELAWVARLQKCLDAQPDSLHVYDCEDGLAVFKGDLPVTYNHSVDSSVDHLLVKPKRGHWEMGAW